jgi:hypothetical protein
VEWHAGARGFFRSGGGDDEQAGHVHQYGQSMNVACP